MATDASFYDDNWTVLQKIKYLAKWFKDNSVDADTLTFDEVNGNVVINGKNFLGEQVNVLTFPVAMLPKGEKGDRGEQGIQGIQGIKGEQGIQGERGEQGIQGERGEQGIQGERGEQGIQGEQGVGIESIVDVSHAEVGNETVTTLRVNYTEGKEPSTFEVHAQNGASTGGAGILISAPSTATNGTLTDSQLEFLNASENNYIIFDNEKYYLMDKNHESGYIVYSHVGHNSAGEYKIKCITITTTTSGWQMNETSIDSDKGNIELYENFISCEVSEGKVYFSVISNFMIKDITEIPNGMYTAGGQKYYSGTYMAVQAIKFPNRSITVTAFIGSNTPVSTIISVDLSNIEITSRRIL